MKYRPQPIDTTQVALGADILDLTELLARNTHEVWARARMAQGWRWGEKRNDDLLLHPDLRPYEELSESEKDYDRSTALETLRTIVALGYRIAHDEPAPAAFGQDEDAILEPTARLNGPAASNGHAASQAQASQGPEEEESL